MSNGNPSSYKVWRVLFGLVYLSIWVIGLIIISNVKIPSEVQPFIATVSAVIWFTSSSLFHKVPDETGKAKLARLSALGFGSLQLIFAILFWIVIKPKTQAAIWLEIYNLFFSIMGVSYIYAVSIQILFPKLLQSISESPPNPLQDFSQPTQQIVRKGNNWIGGTFAIPTAIFFIGGTIANSIYAKNHNGDTSPTILIIIFAGMITGTIASFIATFKWQKWARKSGIPEEELKAAAKAAKLWWPKTKEE